MATANDSPSRTEIIEAAVSRARKAYGVAEFAKLVYVGDAVWDLLAARRLGMGFLGILDDFHAAAPGYEGARTIPDFRDYRSFLEALSAAD